MQYDCYITMEMQRTYCYATGTITLLWKCNKLTVMQQALLRYYGNAVKDLTCHNIYIYIYIYAHVYMFNIPRLFEES
jgi:hypothetical protein